MKVIIKRTLEETLRIPAVILVIAAGLAGGYIAGRAGNITSVPAYVNYLNERLLVQHLAVFFLINGVILMGIVSSVGSGLIAGEVHEGTIRLLVSKPNSRRTILLGSCAPGPLFELPSILSSLYPDRTISTEIREEGTLIAGLKQGIYQHIILNRPPDDPEIACHPCERESLFFSLPKEHPLAGRKTLSFSDMDGETFLVYSEIGVWDELHRRELPHSRFILQSDRTALREIARSSTLPAFATDLSLRHPGYAIDRVSIPISDPSATMSFWCCCLKQNEKRYPAWFRALEQRTRAWENPAG